MATTFALRNFKGNPVSYCLVETEDLSQQASLPAKQVSHHIVILDRSGSMYYDLPDTKTMVEKILTLTEFNDPDQKISLISYSSSGDVKLHFGKVTVEDVLKAGSPYLKEVRGIQVTGLTCISQSLVLAQSLIDDKETTCITLHSDGYANDRSPSMERDLIQKTVADIAQHPNVFVNTIAYRESSDFTLLSKVANLASGVCIQAKTIKQVYEALHNAQALLAGKTAPALSMARKADDYMVFCSKSAGKVLGTDCPEGMVVRGLSAADDKTLFRYTFGDESATSGLTQAGPQAVLAYVRAQIAEGNITNAKFALCGAKSGLLPKHFKALVPNEVAALAADVEAELFSGNFTTTSNYGLSSNLPSVLAVLDVLSKYTKHLRVNTKTMAATYKRRGVKRIPGVRLDDGTVTAPDFELQNANGEWSEVLSFDMNRTTATVNMLISNKAKLVNCKTGVTVTEVAGIDVTGIKDFRNYTVVGDGVICTPVLPLRIADKRCFQALVDLGVLTGTFDPTNDVLLDLGNLPLIDFDQKLNLTDGVYERLLKLSAAQKILAACLKDSSDAFTPEQVAELKAHYLTSALYFSAPTTTHYADLTDALNKGEVDTRLSYKIELGNSEITALGKLPSANAFLDRRFVLSQNGQAVDKPKLTAFLDDTSVWAEKVLGPRIKLTKVDDLLFPIFQSFLLNKGKGAFGDVLVDAGIDQDEIVDLLRALEGAEDKINAFTAAIRSLNALIEDTFYQEVSPLVFYIGATGLVPDGFDAKAMTADQMEQQFSGIVLSKDEKEAMFYVLPNGNFLTVYIKADYFTVG